MRLPYGIADFHKIRTRGFVYVDKTSYIETLEDLHAEHLFFVRPRRFGKSLFLSMLEYYYGLQHKEQFTKLFGDLYIGQHPTEFRNSYFVMRLNFSGLNTANPEALHQAFQRMLKLAAFRFINTYADYFTNPNTLKQQIERFDSLRSIWELLFDAIAQTEHKLYLIIDEYDHFANDIIAMGDGTFYKEITRASGFVRDFYETIKIGTESAIDRIFITGVSPIMLDDLTSGFNIADNITTHPDVGEMLGFTEKDVQQFLIQFQPDADKGVLTDLRQNYNGYCFHLDGHANVYNPDMVLYFFNKWREPSKIPQQLIDDNVKTDYGRLQRLISNESNRETMEQIIQQESISAPIVSRFSFDQMYDEDYFISLLFYMGLLTIKGKEFGLPVLGIPNYVIKTVYWEYFARTLRQMGGINYDSVTKLNKAVWQMAFDGQLKPFVDFTREHVLKVLSNRDLMRFDEKYLKLILLCYLNLSNIYRIVSEREVEKGYAYILLEKDIRMPDIKHEWLLELKYLKESERNRLAEIKQSAHEQLEKYKDSRELANKTSLKIAVLIFIGKTELICEQIV